MEKEIINFEKPQLPIMINNIHIREKGFFRGMHSHTAIEIVEVKKGTLSCCINDEIIFVYPKQVIAINSNIGHRLFSENAEVTYIQIGSSFYKETDTNDEFALLYDFISHTEAKPYTMFSNNNQLNEILGKIYLNYYENQEENRWFLKAYIYELIAFLYSKSFITPLMTYSLNIAKIEPIVRYIDNNFKLPITLEDICNEVKYSKYFICHNFKAITGSTIFEYINFLRVLYAVERLKLKNSTISDIAIESGFSSVTYFDRVFRNIIGCSPSVYRKNF